MPPSLLDQLDVGKPKGTGRGWMEKYHLLLGKRVIFRILMREMDLTQLLKKIKLQEF